jgi:hypothetical protein
MNKPIKNLKLAFDDWGVGETTIILLQDVAHEIEYFMTNN